MKNWFEVNVKYNKIGDDGKDKKVSESYLFDAVSFTEAEARTAKELTPYIKEFLINAIKKAKFDSVLPFDEGQYWFKVSVDMLTVNEAKGKEEMTRLNYLIMADDIKQALARIEEYLSDTMFSYVISNMGISNIIDIFPYVEQTQN